MASEPTVCAILLTKDRPELAARAVRCFERQTYGSKFLLIWNNGQPLDIDLPHDAADPMPDRQIITPRAIGELRNEAVQYACQYTPMCGPDVIVHWDDDEWSHPNRIAEQVALLQSGDYDAVGYGEMLFWRTCDLCDSGRHNTLTECPKCGLKYDPGRETPVGEAYLYSHGRRDYIIGTSLCYWRKTWEQKPFDNSLPNEACGEDHVFQSGLRVKSVSAMADGLCHAGVESVPREPRMIACVHGGNTKIANYNDAMRRQNCFKRVPHWDARVREILENA